MRLLLGYNRASALRAVFRLSGAGGYAKSTGVLRKRLNAILWRNYYKPA